MRWSLSASPPLTSSSCFFFCHESLIILGGYRCVPHTLYLFSFDSQQNLKYFYLSLSLYLFIYLSMSLDLYLLSIDLSLSLYSMNI